MSAIALLAILAILAIMAILPSAGMAGMEKLQPGDPFPDLTLPAPGEYASDLGLANPDSEFRLTDVPGQIALIEISSYFCGPCRRFAPRMNELRSLIHDQGLDRQVKMLSISAGDSPEMTTKFIRELSIIYPMFPDPDLRLHAAAGSVPAPHVFIVRLGPDPVLLDQVQGGFKGSPEKFLKRALELGGIDHGNGPGNDQ